MLNLLKEKFTKDPWKKFRMQVRSTRGPLLQRLGEFPSSILVSGCQRSGTTILSRIITQSEQIVDYQVSRNAELDGALILFGSKEYTPKNGRYCFQTTYLNEHYCEYFKYKNGYKIIWVLRNPYSVVYSILHNWKRFALNELFSGCGVEKLNNREKQLFKWVNTFGVSPLRRACYAYASKTEQIYKLYNEFGNENFLIIDYDEIVNNKEELLPYIFSFINLPYKTEYAEMLHNRSLNKQKNLTEQEMKDIQKMYSFTG